MQIVYKKITELKPYDKNPRKNDEAVEYVVNSIKTFGFKVPIVVDADNVVVCGHTRLKASKKLGLKEVPCIIADDLTDEQIKAFRLADNKVTEKSEWDFDLLSEEADQILDINLEDFGFKFDFEELEDYKEETRNRVRNIQNLELATYEGCGKYDIPPIEPVHDIPEITEWIGFNYVLSDKEPEGKGVHFFIDDYQFERLWNDPDKYIEKLKQYAVVCSPDFSPYGDMPMATQIFNHYRKHWVGKYLQENGVNVIPTIRASIDERSFEWYLDGEPINGVVIISAMWTNTDEGLKAFKKEFSTMVETLEPSKILIYGKKQEWIKNKNVEYIDTFTERWKNG